MSGPLHRAAVQKILLSHPTARTTGFAAACNRIVALTPLARCRTGIIPDAFLVDRGRQAVVAFEVEHTSPTSVEKMRRYVDLWWGLDGMGWALLLVRTDRDGRDTITDIGPYAIDLLVSDARAAA